RMRHGGGLFGETAYRAIRTLGLDVRLEFDIGDFKHFIRTTEWPVVNAAADPDLHDFAFGEVLWLRLLGGGQTIATQVLRVIETGDYVSMLRDHTLFS